MRYVAQVTVRVRQHEGGELEAVLNPTADYRVKHGDKEYTVLLEDTEEDAQVRKAIALAVQTYYKIADSDIKGLLKGAALHGTKVEVYVVEREGDHVVVAAAVPAISHKA